MALPAEDDRVELLMEGGVGVAAVVDTRRPSLMADRTVPQQAHCAITFNNVSHWVYPTLRSRQEHKKQILHDVFGSLATGEAIAIMGPSGSGKSTLLDILAFRRHSGETLGSVLINGQPRTKKFKRVMGYVTQDDVLIGSLTVREALMYAAELRLPKSTPHKRAIVEGVLAELRLLHVAGSKVGTGGLSRGVSGGERKRVSIGVELVVNPLFLFLDEPTSGLDAASAQDVVELLLSLARTSNRGVMFTIHQPASHVFQMFPRLMLLFQGRLAYSGPSGPDAIAFFEKQTGLDCARNINPADFFLHAMATSDQCTPHSVSQGFAGTTVYAAELARMQEREASLPGSFSQDDVAEYARPFHAQVAILLVRELQSNVRNPQVFGSQLAQAILFSLLVGSLWSQLDVDREQGQFNLLFFIALFMSLTAYAACPFLITFRRIYIHERDSGMYTALSFLVAKTLSDIILYSILAFVFSTVVYAIVGLNWDYYGFYLLVCVVEIFTATSAIGFTSVVSPNMEVALVVASFMIGVALIFSGFFVPLGSIPAYWLWLSEVSFMRYALNALVANNFQDCSFDAICTPQTASAPPKDVRCAQLLARVFGVGDLCEHGLPSRGASVAILLALGIGFRLLSLILLKSRKVLLRRFC